MEEQGTAKDQYKENFVKGTPYRSISSRSPAAAATRQSGNALPTAQNQRFFQQFHTKNAENQHFTLFCIYFK